MYRFVTRNSAGAVTHDFGDAKTTPVKDVFDARKPNEEVYALLEYDHETTPGIEWARFYRLSRP